MTDHTEIKRLLERRRADKARYAVARDERTLDSAGVGTLDETPHGWVLTDGTLAAEDTYRAWTVII